MTTEQQEPIIFLMCDDQAMFLSLHRESIGAALEKFCEPIRHEFVTFDDGTGALEWLQANGKKPNVILITDGSMVDMDGFELLKSLEVADLVPAACAMCTALDYLAYEYLKEQARLDNLDLCYIAKNGKIDRVGDFVLAVIDPVAAASGIALPARKPASMPPSQSPSGTAPK